MVASGATEEKGLRVLRINPCNGPNLGNHARRKRSLWSFAGCDRIGALFCVLVGRFLPDCGFLCGDRFEPCVSRSKCQFVGSSVRWSQSADSS